MTTAFHTQTIPVPTSRRGVYFLSLFFSLTTPFLSIIVRFAPILLRTHGLGSAFLFHFWLSEKEICLRLAYVKKNSTQVLFILSYARAKGLVHKYFLSENFATPTRQRVLCHGFAPPSFKSPVACRKLKPQHSRVGVNFSMRERRDLNPQPPA
jgi:hypothetical protein